MASTARPAADVATFFDDLVRCETRLFNALNDHLRERCGITLGQSDFLAYLLEHPGSRVGDLAVTFAIGIGATSKGVDRLEALGWVRRVPNPADRRSSLLEVTEAGEEMVDRSRQISQERLDELLGLSGPELSRLGEVFSGLRHRLERDGIGKPVG